MQFSIVAVLAAATAVSAGYGGNITYTTEVVTAYTTYCPEPTTLTYGDVEYTITEATTLTITDCPCTIEKPVTTAPVEECHDCPAPSEVPVEEVPEEEAPEEEAPEEEAPAPPPAPPSNETIPSPPEEEAPEEGEDAPEEAGAAQAAVLSGAGLAGVLGLAAFIL